MNRLELNAYAKVNLTLPCADISGGFGLNENVDVSNIKFEYVEE